MSLTASGKIKFFSALFCLTAVIFPCMAGDLRVVSLTPSLTETICMLGAEKMLAGRSSACTYPDTVKTVPVAGRFDDPDVERVLSLAPDLVVADHFVNPNAERMLEKASVTVIVHKLETVGDYAEWVKMLGEKLGKENEAAQELSRIEKECSEIKSGASDGARTLFVIWDRPLMVAGQNSFPDEMLRMAGASNAVPAFVSEKYFKCSFEWVLSARIDAVVWCCDATPEKSVFPWKKLPAYKNGRFAVLTEGEKDLILRPGPRMFDGVRLLRKKLSARGQK